MKILLCSFLLLAPPLLHAQDFVEVPFPVEEEQVFDGVSVGSISFADVDGDNDQDLLITGQTYGGERIAKLYRNDGKGNFSTAQKSSIEGVGFCSVAFADVDGDDDQDLLITGIQNNGQDVSKLYRNDGKGELSEVGNTPFKSVRIGSIAFADVDGDNDQDLLITGWNSVSDRIAKLYRNDGKGEFVEVQNTPFEGVYGGSVAFADVDGDDDQDLLITGQKSNRERISKLYRNNGKGEFSEVGNTPFEAISDGSIAFADVDGDNNQDLLIAGLTVSTGENITKLYRNVGGENFFEVQGTPFTAIHNSSIAFADVDGDNDQDLVIAGYSSGTKTYITKLYLNTLNTSTSDEIESIATNSFLSLFPNPSEGSVALSYDTEQGGEASVSIIDLIGITRIQKDVKLLLGQNIIPLDCSGLPSGVYLVELKGGDRSVSTTLIILPAYN